MKCFFQFKKKPCKSNEQQSAPDLKYGSKWNTSGANEVTKSPISVTSQQSISEIYEEKKQKLRVFTYSELKKATNNFSTSLKIGEGGFGTVYRGSIKPIDGKGHRIVVAVKKLINNGFQGHREWMVEVQFLGVVEHPNVVKLIGHCAVDGERGIQRLLVYEFMPNRSLEDHLFRGPLPVLPWQTRLQIMLGAAQGLAYLHEEFEVQIIYRDFKSSNILLDEDFKPKIADFGLATEGPRDGRTHVSATVVGTNGYAAPDYIETGHVTTASDVWSFGVVLYEILTGRRSLERNRPKREQNLLDWVKKFPVDGRRFRIMMDPRLGNQYSLTAARKVAKLADNCLCKYRNERPKMSEVVESLKQAIQISEEGRPSNSMTLVSPGLDQMDSDEKLDQADGSKYAKMRKAHLAKLRENESAFRGRRLMIMQQRALFL